MGATGVVLEPDPGDTEPAGERGRLEQWSEAAVERQLRGSVERKELAVAPERVVAPGNGVAGGTGAVRVDRLQRAEAVFAHGNWRRVELRTAIGAGERQDLERGGVELGSERLGR